MLNKLKSENILNYKILFLENFYQISTCSIRGLTVSKIYLGVYFFQLHNVIIKKMIDEY